MVDEDFAWRLAQELVRIESSDPGAYEDEIERFIKRLIEQQLAQLDSSALDAVQIEELEVLPGRRNLKVTVPGQSESVTLLVFNEETALRRVEAEYKASRPGYMVFLVDGYDDVFSDMLDSERARLLEGINRTLEDMIGRGSGFLGQRPVYRRGGRAPSGAVCQARLRCAG